METTKLEKWAQLLLDMGKRNPLINFKDRKNTTVEFVCPDSQTIFEKLCGDGKLELFDPKLASLQKYEEDSETVIGREEYIATYSPKLKKNQILAYSQTLAPIRTVKSIDKKAKSAIEETGVSIAHVAFGFVHWKDADNPEGEYSAPVLLLPVNLTNDSSVTPYYISSKDDDVTVNPTFLFKLESEYNVTLPSYEGEPLFEYLEKVSDIVKKLGWEVTAEAKLGTFSFLKINMYRDLMDNTGRITANGNVKKILGEWKEEEQPVSTNSPLTFHNVVDADSSQLQAIEMAKSGKSFVLQGPPGTGKSQTITNIIAECLMDGKRVLFVSEKLAALQVVYDKLKKADLSEFCLQLHSYKANKKDVIEDLEHTLKLAKSGVSSKAETELASLERAKRQLDGYASELHTVRKCINLSLYSMYERYSALRKYPDAEFVITDLKNRGEGYLAVAEDCLTSYSRFVQTIGHDYKLNPWYGYKNPDTSYAADLKSREEFDEVLKLIDGIKELSDEIKELCGADCTDVNSIVNIAALFEIIGGSDFISGDFLNPEKSAGVLDAVNKMKFLSSEILSVRRTVDRAYDQDVYKLDSVDAYKKLTRLYGGAFKRLGGGYKAIVNDFRLAKKDGKKPKYKELVALTEKLSDMQQKEAEFNACSQDIEGCLGRAYNGLKTDWGHIIRQGSELNEKLKGINKFGELPSYNAIKTDGLRPKMLELSKRATSLLATYSTALNAVASAFDSAVLDVRAADYRDLRMKLCTCLDEWGMRTNWIQFAKLLERMGYAALRGFIDYCIEHEMDDSHIVEIYKKCFYKQWIDYVIQGSEILASFNRVSQDAAVAAFSEKDRLQFNINKAIIKATLSARRPDLNFVAGGSAISTLLREAQKKRRQKPIRTLLAEIGDLAQVLKPCFMMSPLSVSTFLDSEKIHFDTIVFDEASQIFPQDAIGAIYRGKQLIVVGDSKQMPPSNFFNAMTGTDEEFDDDDEDLTDFESILDLCSTAMPQLRLKWHYRSKFEELISFSNRNFYDGDLVTFPSAIKKREGLGVDYLHVDGVFDRKTKTNRAEAEYIADLVFKNIESYPQRSLGVVAFSASQQELIERCISKRRYEDSSKEDFFKTDREEPFFVKNLETVQGDERDTIIFSMAYARDAQGRFLSNFGPVNRVGGERRLNVAVTRAKYNVRFVSSVHSYDVDLKGSKSEGARLLKQYLDFAENGMVALDRETSVGSAPAFDSDFEIEVYDFLTSNGYEVDTQVGCSNYRIDLALKRPDSAEYLLAIECDGATYHSSLTARDRDRLRQQILEGMGWKFYRIWSTDWFRNNRAEKQLLLSAVKNAAGGKLASQVSTASGEDFVEDKPAVRLNFPTYKIVPVQQAWARAGKDYKKMVKEILKVEAPLSEDWLLRRSLYLFGREKITSVVTDEYEKEMRFCRAEGIIRKNGFLFLEGQTALMLRVPSDNPETQREIKYISPEELAYGLYEIIKHNVSVTRGGLYRELSTRLGYSRVTDAVEAAFGKALELLSSKIELEGDEVRLRR